jgi:hypothetical protein
MTSRVFLPEETRSPFDLSSAEKFGALVTVFRPSARNRTLTGAKVKPSVFDVEAYAQRLLEELGNAQFDPRSDYVLMAGGLLSCAIAMMALAIRYRRFKMLVYNSTMNTYVEKEVDAEEILCTGNTSQGTVVI